jgi:gamma-glutamyl hercynylcysteine S-oxide hydrolase
VTRTRALLAAARSATGGTDLGETAAAPYRSGRWLFSHNGVLSGWPEATAGLAATLPAARLLALEARCDSALAWALVLRQLDEGQLPADALAATVADLDSHGVTGRFNFLLTDGEVIAATAAGDTLSYSVAAGRTVVASEPDDDGHDWIEVPGRSVLTARAGAIDVRPLPAPRPPSPGAAPQQDSALIKELQS